MIWFHLPALPVAHSTELLTLDGAWRVSQPDRHIDLPARVPGSVHTDLLAAKAIPDPFYRDNEKQVQWVGEVPWVYRRIFIVPTSFLNHRHILLRAEGLDTLATIQINGREVAKTGNLFRTWEFDAKPFLHAGDNQIEIRFDPVGPVLKAKENQPQFPGKPAWGQGYVRKTPVQNGWDFAPKLLTCGIPKPIGIVGWDEARLKDVQVQQFHRGGKVSLKIGAHFEGKATAVTNVYLRSRLIGQGSTVSIPKPELWWPAGMGEQPLYDVRTVLKDARGRIVDRRDQQIGLRTIVWTPKTAQHPLSLAVNGRPMFVKGANWIPPDALNARVTKEKYLQLIEMAKGANMNMLRFWGGGLYEDDELYNLCDQAGILVWFEFKFACTPYPAFDPAWVEDVRNEAVDNVTRLRNHPSIAIWSGNNEVAGFVDEKSSLFKMSREDYATLFHKTLANVVRDLVPGAQYTPGSPESGDEHNWAVWHGGAPFETYRDDRGFMSEFGFQSFPAPRTLASVTVPEDRTSLLSPVLKYRQRNIGGHGNENIADTIERYFRKPKDFDSAVWLSQINQAQGILTGIEHWRRDWPHSTGSLVWQFDDDWQTPSWSMVDYDLRPKALYYRLKEAYAPVMLSGFVNDAGKAELWVANDENRPTSGILDLIATRADGTILSRSSRPVAVQSGTTSRQVATFDPTTLLQKVGRDDLMLWAILRRENFVVSRTLVLFTKPKALRLQRPQIRTKIESNPLGYKVTLTTDKPALWTWVESGDDRLTDNFFHLRPGEPQTIGIYRATPPKIRIRSLYDTFDPTVPLPDLTVAPSPDDTIHADAQHAEILGGQVLERGTPPNIGNWSREKDSLEWRIAQAKPGPYQLSLTLASPEGGSQVILTVGKKQFHFNTPKTGSWTRYTTIDLGQVEITQPFRISLRPEKKNGSHIMNLQEITIAPLSSPRR